MFLSAASLNPLRLARHLDYTFDLKRMTAFEGDTGFVLSALPCPSV
jgi:hypothetical protein